jgi:hypothetical protein
MVSYAQTLEQTLSRAGRGAVQEQACERFAGLFADLSQENVRARAPEVYADGAWFHDTLKTLEGRDAIVAYLLESAAACTFCHAEIRDRVVSGPEIYLRWHMEMQLERVAKGRVLRSEGMSHLRADDEGRVLVHHDFWDAGGNLFEHMPVVGWLIRTIKAKL